MKENYGVSKWPDIEEINSKMDKLLQADVLHIKAEARAAPKEPTFMMLTATVM